MEANLVREPKRFFTPAEAVRHCHDNHGLTTVTETTIKKAAYLGDRPLKRTKIGGRIYYELSDIEAWLDSCKVTD